MANRPTQTYEKDVKALLKLAGISQPPVAIERIASALQIRIQRSPLPDDLSGLLVRYNDDEKPLIGVNSLHARTRQRFTVAHEIGHFILHKNETVHVDRRVSVLFRNSESSSAAHKTEIEANGFAAELLMPTEFIRNDVGTPTVDLSDEEALGRLAIRYEVSIQALAFRLMKLGYSPQM